MINNNLEPISPKKQIVAVSELIHHEIPEKEIERAKLNNYLKKSGLEPFDYKNWPEIAARMEAQFQEMVKKRAEERRRGGPQPKQYAPPKPLVAKPFAPNQAAKFSQELSQLKEQVSERIAAAQQEIPAEKPQSLDVKRLKELMGLSDAIVSG